MEVYVMKSYAPKALDEALNLLRELTGESVILLAGGTDVVSRINSNLEKSGFMKNIDTSEHREKHVVFLGNLNLSHIEEKDNEIHIGACTTLTDVLENPIISNKLPLLKKAVSKIAGLAIRNIATLGGNVMNASPAADSIPALMAMDTRLVLISATGERIVPLTGFFKGPGKTDIEKGEILKELIVPVCGGKSDFIKIGRRKAETLSIVNGAGRVVINDGKCTEARLILGAVAAIPLKVNKIEEMLKGQYVTSELIKKAAEEASNIITPITDVRSTAAYRRKVTKVVVERVLKTTCQL
jgi:carbon-monoxide dehydrogenase medium subunit